MTKVPTSGEVLKWAREFRGLSASGAAERLGIGAEDLQEYERGKPVSLSLFERMASRYRLPQATLFLRRPPETPPDLVDFRSIEGKQRRKRSFEFRVALSNVRTLVHKAEQVADDDAEFVPAELPRASLKDDPETLGERERSRLAISIDEQFGWKPSEGFARWRSHLEKQNVLVFQQKFPIEDGRGFSLYNSLSTPTVVVNKSETTNNAKAFTVWHEYCHLLLRQPGISDLGDSQIETFCNKFAAAFLVPTEALRKLLPQWPNQPVEWHDQDINRWASKLKVSRRALAIRLEEKGLAPDGFSRRFSWTVSTKERKSTGGSYINIRLSEIGSGLLSRCLEAYDRGAIDRVQLLDCTGIPEDGIDTMRHYVARSKEMTGAA